MSSSESAQQPYSLLGAWMLAIMAVFHVAKIHLMCTIQFGPWLIRKPKEWIEFQSRLSEVVWTLERHHYSDPEKVGALPHVNTLMGTLGMDNMSNGEEPIVRDLVLVGAGHAHTFVLKMFGMKPERNVRITLITEGVDTPYSGMLPGFISGEYSRQECYIDTFRLSEFANARIIVGRAKKITDKAVVMEDGSPDVPFDICSVNVGSSPQLPQIGADLVSPVKPISRFSETLDRIIARDHKGDCLRIAVVGAGAGGVELLLGLCRRLKHAKEFVLISKTDRVMPSHSATVTELMLCALRSRADKITLRLGMTANRVEMSPTSGKRSMYLSTTGDKEDIVEEFDEILWCTQACGQPLLKNSDGFQVNDMGFVLIDDDLRVRGKRNIFAVGDCCHLINDPCPKAGVFAVRMGMPLAGNLRRLLRGEAESSLEKYIPQRCFLGIVGLGNGSAIGSKGAMGVEGKWVWELKDWIDRKWMSGYTTALPTRPVVSSFASLSPVALASEKDVVEELCHAKMRCGGCGSKVGASILSRVLKTIDVHKRSEVLVGLDHPDDCALVSLSTVTTTQQQQQQQQQVVVQTVDYFRSFWRDEYLFGQIAANHALSDVHAMGSEPVAAMCIVQVPFGPSIKVEQRLSRLMRGAVDFLNKMNCSLVGGHTCEGAELAMGFSVMGQLKTEGEAMKKGGMRIGDALILTKPLGTGAIMAASMRVMAKGEWVQAALESMLIANRDAGICLRDYDASACTDVTGFGLVGHLVEMIRACSNETSLMCELHVKSIPMLPGAVEVVAQHHVLSSLQHENVRAAVMVQNRHEAGKHPAFPLLFDPQTAGGLLATVPFEKADECVEALRTQYGYPYAACIGRVVAKQDLDQLEVVKINPSSS